jgi:hypothetical protein
MSYRVLNCAVSSAVFVGLMVLLSGSDGMLAQSGSRCPAYPAFPDAACTGTLPGVARTSSGSITTSSAGQVIQNLDINGRITVNHNNVTIRNVKITNPRGVAISNIASGATGLLIEDVELDGTGNTSGASAVDFDNYILRRANIHHYGEGPGCRNNAVIEDSYMHTFTDFTSQGAHQDGIQCEFGRNNTIRHNTILMNVRGGNAAVVIGNQPGNADNVVENNLLAGGGYTLYFGGTTGISRNNKFSTQFYSTSGGYGPKWYTGTPTYCGNRWYEGLNAGALLSGESACADTDPAPQPPTNVRIITQ